MFPKQNVTYKNFIKKIYLYCKKRFLDEFTFHKNIYNKISAADHELISLI